MSKTYTVKAKVWIHPGSAPWHFVTIPKKTAEDIILCISVIFH